MGFDKVAASVRRRFSLPIKKRNEDKENTASVEVKKRGSCTDFMYWATLGCDKSKDAEKVLLAEIENVVLAPQVATPEQYPTEPLLGDPSKSKGDAVQAPQSVKLVSVLPPSAAPIAPTQSMPLVPLPELTVPSTPSAPTLLMTTPHLASASSAVESTYAALLPGFVLLPEDGDDDLLLPEMIPLPDSADEDLLEVKQDVDPAGEVLPESIPLPEDDYNDLHEVNIPFNAIMELLQPHLIPLPDGEDSDLLDVKLTADAIVHPTVFTDASAIASVPPAAALPTTSTPVPTHGSKESPKKVVLTVRDFDFEERLGSGGQATVWRARHKKTDMPVAIKVVNKAKVGGRMERFVIREQENMRKLTGKTGIAQLLASFHSSKRFYLVMPIFEGGDLIDVVACWYSAGFKVPETLIRHYGAQLILAIEKMQRSEIYHRDLKPDNIFLDREHNVNVADFGASITQDEYMDILDRGDPDEQEFVGTLEYMAPEVRVGGEHTLASAVYEFGAVLFFLATGRAPYDAEELMDLIQGQMAGEKVDFGTALDLLGEDEEFVSDELLDVLERTLVPVRQRISLVALKRLPFFKGMNWKALDRQTVSSPIFPEYMPPIPAEEDDELEGDDMTSIDEDEQYNVDEDPYPDFYYVADAFKAIVDAPEVVVSGEPIPTIVLDLVDDPTLSSSLGPMNPSRPPRFVNKPFTLTGPFALDVTLPDLAGFEVLNEDHRSAPVVETVQEPIAEAESKDKTPSEIPYEPIGETAPEDTNLDANPSPHEPTSPVGTMDSFDNIEPTSSEFTLPEIQDLDSTVHHPARSSLLEESGSALVVHIPAGLHINQANVDLNVVLENDRHFTELDPQPDLISNLASESDGKICNLPPGTPPALVSAHYELSPPLNTSAQSDDDSVLFDDVLDIWSASVDATPPDTPEPEWQRLVPTIIVHLPTAEDGFMSFFDDKDLPKPQLNEDLQDASFAALDSPALSNSSDNGSFTSDIEFESESIENPTLASPPAMSGLPNTDSISTICSSESKHGSKYLTIGGGEPYVLLDGEEECSAIEYDIPGTILPKMKSNIVSKMTTWVQRKFRLSMRRRS